MTRAQGVASYGEQLWKQALISDPFLKICQVQSLDNYSQLFELVTELPTIEEEFHNYPVPENPELKALEYWQAALQLLCISTGSVNAKRSFSKIRKLQHNLLCLWRPFLCK